MELRDEYDAAKAQPSLSLAEPVQEGYSKHDHPV
jgi:hypothetical protein